MAAPSGAGAMTAEEHLVAAMDAAGLPGAKVAKLLRNFGPEQALMSGSAVLHAILSAEEGGPPAWDPGEFDIYCGPFVEYHVAHGLLLGCPGLESVAPAGSDDRDRERSEPGIPRHRLRATARTRGSLQITSWSGNFKNVTAGFDFCALRPTFDGTTVSATPQAAAAIAARELWPGDKWPSHSCTTPDDVLRLAARLEKYRGRGFGGLPETIQVAAGAGFAPGALPGGHPFAGLYYVGRWDDNAPPGAYGARVLKRAAGRATKASPRAGD